MNVVQDTIDISTPPPKAPRLSPCVLERAVSPLDIIFNETPPPGGSHLLGANGVCNEISVTAMFIQGKTPSRSASSKAHAIVPV
jgi:hypothetical protein